MKKKFFALTATVVFLIVILNFIPINPVPQVKSQLEIGNTTINIELADTPEEQIQGLSGRSGLENDEGLLFVFSDTAKRGFWMKDMNFSIDIIWIAESGEIIGIEKAVSPSTYPKVFYSPRDIKYVLEVKEGFSDMAKVNVGDVLYIGQ
ncbi:MAG: DUF192 domain-containing protein [Minisyncoccota bacterium]